jgi:hypothetical protein
VAQSELSFLGKSSAPKSRDTTLQEIREILHIYNYEENGRPSPINMAKSMKSASN